MPINCLCRNPRYTPQTLRREDGHGPLNPVYALERRKGMLFMDDEG